MYISQMLRPSTRSPIVTDENNRRFLALNAAQYQKLPLTVVALPPEYNQPSENALIIAFADGNPVPEFHLSANDAAYHSVVVGGTSRQSDAPHLVDAVTVARLVVLPPSARGLTHPVERFPLAAWLNSPLASLPLNSCPARRRQPMKADLYPHQSLPNRANQDSPLAASLRLLHTYGSGDG